MLLYLNNVYATKLRDFLLKYNGFFLVSWKPVLVSYWSIFFYRLPPQKKNKQTNKQTNKKQNKTKQNKTKQNKNKTQRSDLEPNATKIGD